MSHKKIVFSGGHHTSALEVARALKAEGYQIYWLGHKQTMPGDKHLSLEYQEVVQAGIDFIELKAGKLSHKHRLINFLKIPLGFGQSFWFLLTKKPDLIVSFGGYLGFPLIICGRLLGIHSLIHEQTAVGGRTNRWLTFIADKIMLTWPQSQQFFPKLKTTLTGLPLRQDFVTAKPKKLFKNKLPTIYITGGKQGAHIINQNINQILVDLLTKFNVIHQTGYSQKTKDYENLSSRRLQLPPKYQKRYLIKPFFSAQEAGQIFKTADLIISRAGAHTVYELAYLKKPAILIPLPFAARDEQYQNAQILVKLGLAKIISQSHLNPTLLWQTILEINQQPLKADPTANYPQDGLLKVIKEIKASINEQKTR
jgi:UDP-N-acetylglucosamine--N-acetylmuramyl-(pentapeptide) pyrophosphoryl-undecaprenol N-acetylglucosamine transferase